MNEFNTKVSIIIPVYNGFNYMKEAIDSALAQTYKNTEVIVVNDGSNDGGKTEKIALSYGDKIRYFPKENGGVASALNLGIREMTGEWFAWLSHDDMFSPDRIDEDMKLVRENGDIKVVFCRKRGLIESSGKLIRSYMYPFERVTSPWETLVQNNINMCTMTIHRSCFSRTGLFNEANRTTQDVEFTLLLSKNFAFYSNGRSVTYLREHSDRGTYRLKEQHRRDRLYLAEFIMKNFTFQDFFKDADTMGARQLAASWSFLGNIYSYLGAYGYADECYRNGFFAQKRILSMVGIKYLIGARRRDWCVKALLSGYRFFKGLK